MFIFATCVVAVTIGMIGMTGAAEAGLSREAGLHFAAVAYSINYGPGLVDPVMKIDREDLDIRLPEIERIVLEVLRKPFEPGFSCDHAVYYTASPRINLYDEGEECF